jgi:hypothetical protein
MQKPPKQAKFNFEELKTTATSPDPAVRKQTFIEYFERFEEFPSYLFDNSEKIDDRLFQTIQDLKKDPGTSTLMQKGLEILLNRLPTTSETI